MFAGKLIKDSIPPLKPTDTCQRALLWMDEFHVNNLPVINGRNNPDNKPVTTLSYFSEKIISRKFP